MIHIGAGRARSWLLLCLSVGNRQLTDKVGETITILDFALGDDVDLADNERSYRDGESERRDQHTRVFVPPAFVLGDFDLEKVYFLVADCHSSPQLVVLPSQCVVLCPQRLVVLRSRCVTGGPRPGGDRRG